MGTHPDGAQVLIGRLRHGQTEFDMRAPRAEVVVVQAKHAKILIHSASAHEYFGTKDYLGRKYAHLDVEFLNMHNQELFEGVLPEIWGIKPMSSETRAMVKNI